MGGQAESPEYFPPEFAKVRSADSGGTGIDRSAGPWVRYLFGSVSFCNQQLVRRARGLGAILHR